MSAKHESTTRLYLFIARRDHTDVRVVAILDGVPRSGRVTDLAMLGLSADLMFNIQRVIHENRMYWEPWIEPANSYQELRQKLLARGYKNLPFSSSPIVPVAGGNNRVRTNFMPPNRVMMGKPKI